MKSDGGSTAEARTCAAEIGYRGNGRLSFGVPSETPPASAVKVAAAVAMAAANADAVGTIKKGI